MSINGFNNSLRDRRLEAFLDSHDLHLLADPTEAASVGSIYKKDSSEDKLRRIGDVSNFITPSIILPEPKKGLQSPINENFRNNRSLNFMAKIIAKFVWSLAFSADSSKQELLEVNYDKVEYEEVEPVPFAKQLKGHSLDVSNWLYNPSSQYCVVTKVVKSRNFRVNVKVSSDLRTMLAGSGEQPAVSGDFRIEFARGKFDEAIMTYLGERPLVFAVHLEELEFVRNNGNLVNMRPLSEAVRVLAPRDRIIEIIKEDDFSWTTWLPTEFSSAGGAGSQPPSHRHHSSRDESEEITKPYTAPKVNVWIDSYDSKEPLLVGEEYELKVNVGALKSDAIISTDAELLESLTKKYGEVIVDVSLVGDSFNIDPQMQQLSLTSKGDSDAISFWIKPLLEGSQRLSMLFYYKLNLLLVIAIPLDILKERAAYPKTGGSLRNTQIVASSESGFASIFEIDKTA